MGSIGSRSVVSSVVLGRSGSSPRQRRPNDLDLREMRSVYLTRLDVPLSPALLAWLRERKKKTYKQWALSF